MILCATFVPYYLTNTVEHKTINKLNNNPTNAAACRADQHKRGKIKHSQRKQIKQLTL